MGGDKQGEFFYPQWMMTKSMRMSALIISLGIGIHADCFGLSYDTPEGCAADAVAIYSRMYSLEHGGKTPASWDDLRPMFTVPPEEVMSHSAPAKRYAFVAPPIPLLPPHQGDLIAINRSDIYDSTMYTGLFGREHGLKGPGRYMIMRTPNGEFERLWVKPDYVHQVFESASTQLPLVDTEPEGVWVTKARNEVFTRRVIYGALVVGILYFLWWMAWGGKRLRS